MMKHPKFLNTLSTMNYKVSLYILIIIFLCCNFNAFCQGKVTRPTPQQSRTIKPHKSVPKVTVSEPDGFINGHGYVDLGLPSGTKWATCNVGATNSWDVGDLFTWGDVVPKDEYSKNTASLYLKSDRQLRDNKIIDSSGQLTPQYDATLYSWGNPWITPTSKEFNELIDNCKFIVYNYNKSNGILIVGLNKKTIFLPFPSYKTTEEDVQFIGESGMYQSSEACGYNAYALSIVGDYLSVKINNRIGGFPIRGVLHIDSIMSNF